MYFKEKKNYKKTRKMNHLLSSSLIIRCNDIRTPAYVTSYMNVYRSLKFPFWPGSSSYDVLMKSDVYSWVGSFLERGKRSIETFVQQTARLVTSSYNIQKLLYQVD